MPHPGQPQFLGYPPQAVASPATLAPGLAGPSEHPHHRRPVTPPKAGRGRSPSQHHRRRKGDRSRRPRHGRREDEEVPPAQFVPLKFFLQLFLRKLPTLCLHRLLNGMKKLCFNLCCEATQTSYPVSCSKPLVTRMPQRFLRMDCRPPSLHVVRSSLLGELFNNSRPPHLAGDFPQQSAEHD